MKLTLTQRDNEPSSLNRRPVKVRQAVSLATPNPLQRRCFAWVAAGSNRAVQRQQAEAPVVRKKNTTGMPDGLIARMQGAFQRDFSHVTVHPSSPKAPAVGALAYTQGSDIHFAPGQFRPESSAGRELIGHELAHVVQQREGRVAPTCEVAGMPVNDNPGLEAEADVQGKRAAGFSVGAP